VASDPTVSRRIDYWPRTPVGRWRRSGWLGRRPGPGRGGWLAGTLPIAESTPPGPLVIDVDATLVTAAYAYASDQATRLTDPSGEFPCLALGRNPDGGCRGAAEARGIGLATQNGRDALSGIGHATNDILTGLGRPSSGQAIIDGAKATVADCYAGLTSTVDPVAHCLQNISGLSQLIEGLTLAFHGCVYIGAYIATGGAIQLTLTLAPLGIGRAAAAAAEDAATGGLIPGRAATTETTTGEAVDVGHAGIHQFPGVAAGRSQFFDGEDLGRLSNTDGVSGVLQKNGNTRYVMHSWRQVGIDRTTGLPTNVYTVIRKPGGSVLTMFPGTSPKS
jgi:hypothetical protein